MIYFISYVNPLQKTPIPQGRAPPNLKNEQEEGLDPVGAEQPHPTKNFGDVVNNAKPTYRAVRILAHIHFSKKRRMGSPLFKDGSVTSICHMRGSAFFFVYADDAVSTKDGMKWVWNSYKLTLPNI